MSCIDVREHAHEQRKLRKKKFIKRFNDKLDDEIDRLKKKGLSDDEIGYELSRRFDNGDLM